MTGLYTGSRVVIWWRTWCEAVCLSRTGSSLLAASGVLSCRFPICLMYARQGPLHSNRKLRCSISNQQFTEFPVRPKFLSSLRILETAWLENSSKASSLKLWMATEESKKWANTENIITTIGVSFRFWLRDALETNSISWHDLLWAFKASSLKIKHFLLSSVWWKN